MRYFRMFTLFSLGLWGCNDPTFSKSYDPLELSILYPADSDVFAEGMSVVLEIQAVHDPNVELEADHTWEFSSDVRGTLAGVVSFLEGEDRVLFETSEVELGEQVITATGNPTYSRDSDSESVTITVVPNTPPTLEIVSPEDGEVIEQGGDVVLSIAVDDDTEPDLTDMPLTWSLDCGSTEGAPVSPEADGTASFTLVEPAAAVCALTVTVEDSLGELATDGVSFEVAVLDADGDGFVRDDLGGDDCDDLDAAVNPAAEEVCDDSIDNDCDGEFDECGLAGEHDVSDADWIIYGSDTGAHLGSALATGDYNLDGEPDLLLSEPDLGSGGRTWLALGPIAQATAVISDLSDSYVDSAGPNEELGFALADGADLDGDGVDDGILGAPRYDNTEDGQVGRVVVLLGASGESFAWEGVEGGEQAGTAVASTDLNGDGVEDLIVGAPLRQGEDSNRGYVYVRYGPITAMGVLDDADATLSGSSHGEQLGTALAALGDMNGDGVEDLAVGAPNFDADETQAGAVYIVAGQSAGSSGGELVGLLEVDGESEIRLTGESSSAYAGAALGACGDLDSDGRADLVVGAYGDRRDTSGAGAAYVVTGLADATGDFSLGDPSVSPGQIRGLESGDHLGTSVACGAITEDSSPELLVGVPNIGTNTGAALLFGAAARDMGVEETPDTADAVFTTELGDSQIGTAVHGGANLNGDTRAEVMIGAWDFNPSTGAGAGAVFIFRGREL